MGLCFGTMCEHVVVEHQIFYWLKYRKHSTAQQSARTEPQSKCVPIRVRQRKQAESFYCIAVPRAPHSIAQSACTKPQSKYVLISV